MAGIDLRRERYERDFEMINDDRVPSSGKRSGWCEWISCQDPLYIAYTWAPSLAIQSMLGLETHGPKIIGAEIPGADIIAPDNENVGFASGHGQGGEPAG